MPITLTDAQRAALESNAIAIRVLIDLYLDSGRYSFWDGGRDWEYDGTIYRAASDFGEISSIRMGQDLGAEGMELKLNGTKMQELSPDPLDPGALFGTIESEPYQMRRTHIHFAFFDVAPGARGTLLFKVRRYAGLIDQIRQVEEIGDDGMAQAMLVVSLESVARRYGVRSGRKRTAVDQREIYPDDSFFDFVPQTTAKQGSLYWGRLPPGAARPTSLPGLSFLRKPRFS